MQTNTTDSGLTRRFEIAYQEFAGSRFNLDLRGKGTLSVSDDGRKFIFSGRKRLPFVAGEHVEREFLSDQIWNVRVVRSGVEFTTNVGKSAEKQQPFVFFCASADEARQIAELLPQRKDEEFHAGAEFAVKLRRLGGAPSWQSPTNLIISANIVVFILMGVAGAGWFEVADIMPYIRFGANRADLTTDGEWWRLVSCMFIHFGFLHLLLNMWALLQVGHLAEKLFGRTLYLLAYFGSGIIGSMATLLWHNQKLVLSAGASGAVFGTYGALLGYIFREKHGFPKNVFQPLLKSTLVFAGYNLFYGAVHPNIDNAAHLGGLVGGIALGWMLALPLEPELRGRKWKSRFGIGILVTAIVVAAGVAKSPRFDYRLVDELAWNDINKAPVEKEPSVVHEQETTLTAFVESNDAAPLEKWLRDVAVPFYSRWNSDLRRLNLAPKRSTDRRRDRLSKILQMKIDSFTRLAEEAQHKDANALENFQREQEAIAAELKRFSEQTKK